MHSTTLSTANIWGTHKDVYWLRPTTTATSTSMAPFNTTNRQSPQPEAKQKPPTSAPIEEKRRQKVTPPTQIWEKGLHCHRKWDRLTHKFPFHGDPSSETNPRSSPLGGLGQLNITKVMLPTIKPHSRRVGVMSSGTNSTNRGRISQTGDSGTCIILR